ncbi:adenosine 3'-phospho 5'-phosphosulfate transporter 2 [Halyomorpha halys]|uniref:adenosine 3'-phospho 5'-phosphosulfate transporter 2 n=1 Tax=Halyomorpha halys TaxID=286706 RepID=UPI000D0C8028|nr:adenosine 3'-phospho 5'-phosphosulfate transporter 2 [Halyomorpha halys]
METRINLGDPKNGPNLVTVQKKQTVQVLYVDNTNCDPKVQFIISCLAVFVVFLLYGYLQELIFTLDGFKPYGWYLTLVQFILYSTFSFIECTVTKTERRIPLKAYIFLAMLTLGTMGFSNSSLAYLNYPTQVIFKCCKLIPVMIGSIVIQHKRYNIIDFSAAICMCIGLSLFTLADSQLSPNFNIFGVIMISSALVCDALIGNYQEKWMKKYNASNREVILFSYSIGFLYLFVIMLFSGSLWSGIVFCYDKPHIYGYAFLFSTAGYLGVQVVLGLVRTCGALTAVTVTTSRKALSIVISFIFFAKPFTMQYFWAGLLVIFGIYLNLMSKNQKNLCKSNFIHNIIKRFTPKSHLKSFTTTV